MKKVRTDEFIFENFNVGSLEDIKRLIMAGKVLNNNEPVYKPSDKLDPEKAEIRFKNVKEFVSRGGLKMQHAIRTFKIDMDNITMLDIGSSTGGFTDCALKSGAKLVYAVDVGTNQLDYKLRTDERVVVMEQTNFKDTSFEDFKILPDLISIDVSFTSIVPILRHIKSLFSHQYAISALIKPQFESYLEEREESGIITNQETHQNVIKRVLSECEALGFSLLDISQSPIKGSKGNIEYLCFLNNDGEKINSITEEDISMVVHR